MRLSCGRCPFRYRVTCWRSRSPSRMQRSSRAWWLGYSKKFFSRKGAKTRRKDAKAEGAKAEGAKENQDSFFAPLREKTSYGVGVAVGFSAAFVALGAGGGTVSGATLRVGSGKAGAFR